MQSCEPPPKKDQLGAAASRVIERGYTCHIVLVKDGYSWKKLKDVQAKGVERDVYYLVYNMRTQRLHTDVYTTLAGVVGPLRNEANEAKLLRCIHTTKFGNDESHEHHMFTGLSLEKRMLEDENGEDEFVVDGEVDEGDFHIKPVYKKPVPMVQQLIAELNEILAHDVVYQGAWKCEGEDENAEDVQMAGHLRPMEELLQETYHFFYNGLCQADQDSLNSATGGNLMTRKTQEALTTIENKAKVRTCRNKPQGSSSGGTSTQIDAITALTKQVEALEYHIASMRETYDQNQEAAVQLMQNQMGQMAEAL
ncbi:hypothetical protein Tco_0834311 [Tanacetum coccineum]